MLDGILHGNHNPAYSCNAGAKWNQRSIKSNWQRYYEMVTTLGDTGISTTDLTLIPTGVIKNVQSIRLQCTCAYKRSRLFVLQK